MNLKDSGAVHQPAELCTMKSVTRQGLRSTACALLMSDAHASVLQILTRDNGRAYCAYGYHQPFGQVPALLAFNGECVEPQTGNYLLGNGNRTYSPVLMRFHSSDPYSPFEQGGLNTYAYCLGDPINNFDPTGNWPWSRKSASAGVGKSNGSYSVLRNTMPGELANETERLNCALKEGVADVQEIKEKKDLGSLVSEDPKRHSKWVLTENNEFVIGMYALEGPKLTHAAIANHASKALSTSPDVIAAGEIKIKRGQVFITDWSGHYLPPSATLAPARKRLQAIGIKATSMRIEQ